MNEVELLFMDVLNCDRLSLYLNRDLKLDKDKTHLLSEALRRRATGEPIEYILGKTEFMGLSFKVTPDVLIPRPETEISVETILRYATKPLSHQATRSNILDIGTGSGCIAVSLAKLLPDVKITATDISQEALEVAKVNAVLNNVEVNFVLSDLFVQSTEYRVQYDIIVSNPPYVRSSEIGILQPEIGYEPRIALDGGEDGLGFYRRIVALAPDFLKQKGFLIMEIGFKQKRAVEGIFKNSAGLKILKVIKDYNNINRVIVAQKI